MRRRGMTGIAWLIGLTAMAVSDVVGPATEWVLGIKADEELVADPVEDGALQAPAASGGAQEPRARTMRHSAVDRVQGWRLDAGSVRLAGLDPSGRPTFIDHEDWARTAERHCPWGS